MSTYKIEVRAQGYDTTEKIVEAATLREAMAHGYEAVMEWCEANCLDADCADLAFTTITKQ